MKKNKDVNAAVVETAALAQAKGMSYGQYVAWQQTQRERKEREERGAAHEQETS